MKNNLKDGVYGSLTEKTATLLGMLKSGQIDDAFLANPKLPPGIDFIPLFEDPFKLAVYSGHPLCKAKEIDITVLNDESMLFLEKGHCLCEQVMALNLNPAQSIQCNSTGLETLRQMVIAELGITIMPQIATSHTYNQQGVHYIPFTPPSPSRAIGLAFRQASIIKSWIPKLQSITDKTLVFLSSQ